MLVTKHDHPTQIKAQNETMRIVPEHGGLEQGVAPRLEVLPTAPRLQSDIGCAQDAEIIGANTNMYEYYDLLCRLSQDRNIEMESCAHRFYYQLHVANERIMEIASEPKNVSQDIDVCKSYQRHKLTSLELNTLLEVKIQANMALIALKDLDAFIVGNIFFNTMRRRLIKIISSCENAKLNETQPFRMVMELHLSQIN